MKNSENITSSSTDNIQARYCEADVICRLFKAIEGDTEYNSYVQRLSSSMTFNDLKPHISHAFKVGAKVVRLYEDYRKKQHFIEIKKEDFSDEEILIGYEILQRKNKIEYLNKRKKIIQENLKQNEIILQKIECEIRELSVLQDGR